MRPFLLSKLLTFTKPATGRLVIAGLGLLNDDDEKVRCHGCINFDYD